MQDDLFTADPLEEPRRIDLPDADVLFHGAFLGREEADTYLETFLSEVTWSQSEVFVWGKWHKQPRLVAWYGDPGATYSYSGTTMQPRPWTDDLQRLRQRVESVSGTSFNSVLFNLYRDKNDCMGWHSDNEPELGPAPTIASISFGAERDFLFKHRREKQHGTRRIALNHGSLLIMAGKTQHNWLHSLAKERAPVGKRINLTFRSILRKARQ